MEQDDTSGSARTIEALVRMAERLAGTLVEARAEEADVAAPLRAAAGDDVELLIAAEHRLRDVVESGRADGPVPAQAAELLQLAACRAAIARPGRLA